MATVVIQKHVGKRGTTYAVRYVHPLTGKWKYYKSFKKKKDANFQASELRVLLENGGIPEKRKKLNLLTFSEVAVFLKEEWKKRNSRGELSDKTVFDYLIWLNVLEKQFAGSLLCKVSKDDVLEIVDSQVEKNSVISANKYLLVLKFVFRKGVELKAIVENPVEDIKLLNEKKHERKEFLLPKQLDSLICASKKTRAKFYLPAIIFLGAEHGASKQEILSLTWPKIIFDWEEKGIITFFRTKNKKERTEFLMPRTREALLKWKEHQEWMRKRKRISSNGSNLVFCRLNGEPLKGFRKAWKETCRIAGIDNFHFHDLRHTFCSNLILSGADLKTVKEMIGHNDLSQTDRYSHLTLLHMNERQVRLAAHYQGNSSV